MDGKNHLVDSTGREGPVISPGRIPIDGHLDEYSSASCRKFSSPRHDEIILTP